MLTSNKLFKEYELPESVIKLEGSSPIALLKIFRSYLKYKCFQIPQNILLGLFFFCCITDMLIGRDVTTVTVDTTILTPRSDPRTASETLQYALSSV